MYSKVPVLTLSRNGHKYGCKSSCFRAETRLPSDEITEIFLARVWLLDRSSSRHLRLLHARDVSLALRDFSLSWPLPIVGVLQYRQLHVLGSVYEA
jgi:hypothetical protein